MNGISLQDVTKTYRGRGRSVTALSDVTVEAGQGEFVAVQGPSGCGKTTLLLVAGGLLAPDAGKVTVQGRDLYALGPEERARFRAAEVGFVFQQFHLVPYLSVLENVLSPTLAFPMTDAQKRARELLARFDLEGRADHLPPELSTGERQRVALARAMLSNPRIILADEPTGNLDERNSEQVLQALAGFADEGGTVLLVTHSRSAADCAARRVLMENGRLVAEGAAVAGTAGARAG